MALHGNEPMIHIMGKLGQTLCGLRQQHMDTHTKWIRVELVTKSDTKPECCPGCARLYNEMKGIKERSQSST